MAYDPSYMFSGEGAGGAATGAGMGFMIGGPVGAGIGAGAGLLIGGMQAQEAAEREKRERELAARTQELSPWTGLQAGKITQRQQGKAAMAGLVSGAQMYGMGKMNQANIGAAQQQAAATKAQTAYMKQATANLQAQNAALQAQQANAYVGPSPYGGANVAPTQAALTQREGLAYMGGGATPYSTAMSNVNYQPAAPTTYRYSPDTQLTMQQGYNPYGQQYYVGRYR